MRRLSQLPRAISLAALLAISIYPATANAGQDQEAIAAIALAKGKIESGDKVGANSQAPEIQSRARSALTDAETLLSRGKENRAISSAKDAGELADQAIFVSGQQTAAVRDEQIRSAQVSASAAQKAEADANSRTVYAEQTAAVAVAQADVLRNMPPTMPVVVVTPKPVVRYTTSRRVVTRTTHRVVRKPAPVVTKKTTTTITTSRP
jgi:hypothetical protein